MYDEWYILYVNIHLYNNNMMLQRNETWLQTYKLTHSRFQHDSSPHKFVKVRIVKREWLMLLEFKMHNGLFDSFCLFISLFVYFFI